jgi:hypothetical protein
MSTEKTFTIVGTAVNADGTIKVRWANDLVSRIKILDKAGCEDIDLIELPTGMTKLEAAKYFLANRANLNDAQMEILELKIAEKSKVVKRSAMKTTLTKNVKTRIADKAPTDPRVEKFVEQNSETIPAK